MKTSSVSITLTRSAIVLVAVYVASQLIADIGSLKIALLFGISVDAGTFVYPVTFTLRDMIHKKLGKKAAQTLVVICVAINALMALYFALITLLPSDPSWGLQDAFAAILGPVWRIVAASIVAELISELLDTEVYHLWCTKVTKKHQWARVLVSNAVSVPVDSVIFAWIAFGGELDAAVVWSIVLANIIIKGIVTLVSIPAIYLVKGE